jgi:uncharacterized protein YdeI (YjbR/CyaY-like superfamily)
MPLGVAFASRRITVSQGSGLSEGVVVSTRPELPIMPFVSREAWEAWLEEEHATSEGLWLKIAKKGSGVESVTFVEALDAALCYGWIDSQRNGLDGRFYLQRFTPRKPRGKWSQVNREKVARLIEAGRMRPAGLREVERAKADGRWDAAYEPQSAARVPDDLRLELERDEGAREFFETLNSTNRYAILHRIQDAKKPETRARRIAKYVAMLAEGKKLYP